MKLGLIFIGALASLSFAQVQVKGRFQETLQQLVLNKAKIPVVHPSKKVDNSALLQEELSKNNDESSELKPFRFAEAVPIDLDASVTGVWEEVIGTDGERLSVWQAIVASDDALTLSLNFEDFQLPSETEFYIRGRDDLLGAFTPAVNNKEDGKFSTIPVSGDFLGLILVMPSAQKEAIMKELRFNLESIAHGFRKIRKDFEDSANCNINVACERSLAYERQIRSVAMLMTTDGTRFCTGTLINNTSRNKRQLFLTANHCLGSLPSRWVAIFNYQSPTCSSVNIVEPSISQSASGMRLLATWQKADFALLEIVETIPNSYNAYLAGWDVSNRAATGVYGIHHPSCDIKKISFSTLRMVPASWDEMPFRYHWMVPRWTRGTTEPGSSGSALFNNAGLLIGQLHGGLASCSMPLGYDLYGAISSSWTGGGGRASRLRDHLNPIGAGVQTLQGMELRR